MAYLGNTAASRFVSNRAASVYSGDGSTVAFTLEQVVTQDEDILVSVDGVVQEPSVGYAVSSGTTLTFSAAPSTNSGNNIFVYYLASQAGTVGHPSTQALSATVGTFSSNATVGGTLGVTGATTLTGATALGNTGSTVKSEGGAVTTIIAQGLAKATGSLNMVPSTAAKLSGFNVSTFTDRDTGSLYGNYASNMVSVTDIVCVSGITSAASGSLGVSNGNVYSLISGDTTARYSQNCALVSNNSMSDEEAHQAAIFGNLA